jgi:hypothetical protein
MEAPLDDHGADRTEPGSTRASGPAVRVSAPVATGSRIHDRACRIGSEPRCVELRWQS